MKSQEPRARNQDRNDAKAYRHPDTGGISNLLQRTLNKLLSVWA